jgi:hypothetical protein
LSYSLLNSGLPKSPIGYWLSAIFPLCLNLVR